MKSTLWWLGLIFGTLSVVMLIKHGFDYGFVVPLQLILDYYDQATLLVLGWAEPWIEQHLVWLGARIGLSLQLEPVWRHVFVLLLGTVAAVVRGVWDVRRSKLGTMIAVLGVLMALISSVLWGAAMRAVESVGPLASATGYSPLAALVALDLVATIFASSGVGAKARLLEFAGRMVLLLLLFHVAIVVLVGLLPPIPEAASPQMARDLGGKLTSIVAVMSYGLLWVASSMWRGSALSGIGLDRHRRLNLGAAILSTIMGAAFFVLTNAGLKLAGL